MTAILAINRNGQTWIASDSTLFWGSLKQDIGPKYFVSKGIGIAWTGPTRSSNIIERRARSYRWKTKKLDYQCVMKFAEWLRDHMLHAGAKKEAGSGDDFPDHGYLFLLTDGRKIFSINSDSAVVQHRRFFAAGAGQEYCVGVLEALYDIRGISTRAIARKAINAAIKWSAWVGGKAHARRIRPS